MFSLVGRGILLALCVKLRDDSLLALSTTTHSRDGMAFIISYSASPYFADIFVNSYLEEVK